MKKNLNSVLLNNLIKNVVSAITVDDESAKSNWMDDMFDGTELSIEDLLNKSENSDWDAKLKYATDLMNKNIEKAVEKVNNKERKVLIDRPVSIKGDEMVSNKEELCGCGCGKPVEKCSCNEPKVNKLNVANAFTADSLHKANKVRLINVNKTAEKILSVIYSDIKSNAKIGSVEYDFMDERWDSLLLNVRAKTVEKVLDRVANHLIANGFAVSTSNSYSEDSIEELYMSIIW